MDNTHESTASLSRAQFGLRNMSLIHTNADTDGPHAATAFLFLPSPLP